MKAVAGVPKRIKRRACTAKLARTLRRAGDSRADSPDGVAKTQLHAADQGPEWREVAGRVTFHGHAVEAAAATNGCTEPRRVARL